MKIKDDDFKQLELLRDNFLQKHNLTLEKAYKIALPVMDEDIAKIKDIGVYTRWTLSNYSKTTKFICDNLYSYLNDEHINTALKKIWGI